MASGWQRLPEGGGAGRAGHRAAGQRPGPGSSGGLGVRGAGSQPHKPRDRHAPSRPSSGGEERRAEGGREAEGGRRGPVVRAGGVGERGRGVPVWREMQRPCGTRAGLPGGARNAGAERWAGRAGKATRRRGSLEHPQRRVPLAFPEASSLRSAARALCRRQPPPLFWERAARDEGSGGGAPKRQLGAGASAADRAQAPGGGTFLPRPQAPCRPFAPLRGQPRAREASPRSRRRAQL